jgi:signal transduction histidine kinase
MSGRKTEAEPLPDGSPTLTASEAGGRERGPFLSSVRVRILFSSMLLLAVAITATELVVRRAIHLQLDRRIDADLVQETKELRRLAGGNDPETGERFGADVERIFDVFFDRNVPVRGEAFLSFIDGELDQRSRTVTEYALDQDDALIETWTSVTGADRSLAGSVETPAGAVRYLAVPVGERGVFVAVIFRDLEAEELQPALRAIVWVGLAMLLIGAALAWRVASRVLRPVKLVTETARAITETDLTRRIPVEGDDEVSRLSRTFNAMLDRLEGAFHAQRAFVDDAGHELRTPITIIRGHLELLEDDPVRRRETVDLVMDELDRMSRIVNDLLLLAKAEEPDFLDLSVVDVTSLTTETLAKARAIAPRRWIAGNVGRGRVVADRQRITQALIALADNAANHTGPDDQIEIGSLVVGGEARLWVQDTGPGIAPEDRERIFERFARGGARRRSVGAGLGLAIVQAIARAHRGRVELASVLGRGATFTVVIPADQPEAIVDHLPRAGTEGRGPRERVGS